MEDLLAPERFLKELWVHARFVQLRIEALKYKVVFETEYTEVATSVKLIGEAFRAVLTSTSFQMMIRSVLRIGNFLNSNTAKGNVSVTVTQGINLGSLGQLDSFLSLDKKTSLLQFIVATALEKDKTALTFTAEFDVCEPATKSDLADSELKLKEFETGLNRVRESLKKLEQVQEAELVLFKDYMGSFVQGAGIQLQSIKEAAAKVKANQQTVAEMYAENKDGKSSELLKKFSDFALSCKRVREYRLRRKLSVDEGKKVLAQKREQHAKGEVPQTRPTQKGGRTMVRLSVRKRKEGLVAL